MTCFFPKLTLPLFSQSHSQQSALLLGLILLRSAIHCADRANKASCVQPKKNCHFFSNNFLSSAATVCYTGKCNAFFHSILINMSADLGKQICFFSAKANQCMPVFSFQHRSVVCWDLPTVTEQEFGPHSNSVYFLI